MQVSGRAAVPAEASLPELDATQRRTRDLRAELFPARSAHTPLASAHLQSQEVKVRPRLHAPTANAVATCTPLPVQQQTVFRPPAGRWLALQPTEQRTRGGAAAAACAQRFTLCEGSDGGVSSPLASAPDDVSFWSDSSSCSSNPGSANSLMGEYYRDPFTWGKLAQAAFDGVHASRHARAALLPDGERGGPWACTIQPGPRRQPTRWQRRAVASPIFCGTHASQQRRGRACWRQRQRWRRFGRVSQSARLARGRAVGT